MSDCQNFNSYQHSLKDQKICEVSHCMNADKLLDKRNRQEDIDKLLAESKIKKIEKKKRSIR